MSTEKRSPTADEIAKLIKQSWNSAGSQYPIVEKLRDALEAQADQLKQARECATRVRNRPRTPPNVPVMARNQSVARANPAPTTESEQMKWSVDCSAGCGAEIYDAKSKVAAIEIAEKIYSHDRVPHDNIIKWKFVKQLKTESEHGNDR